MPSTDIYSRQTIYHYRSSFFVSCDQFWFELFFLLEVNIVTPLFSGYHYVERLFPFFSFQPMCFFNARVYFLQTVCSQTFSLHSINCFMSLPLQPLLCVETHHRTPPISKQCVRVRVTPVCMSSHWQIKAFLWGLHRGPGIFGSLSQSRSLDLNCSCNLSLDLGLGFWLSEPGLLGRVATDLFPSVRVGISVKAGQQSLQLGPFGILGLTTLGVTRALTTSVAAFIASHCGPASSAGLPCYASRQSACFLGTWS